jgi:hypothetical protein
MADFKLYIQIHAEDSELGDQAGEKEYPYGLSPSQSRDDILEVMRTHAAHANENVARAWRIEDAEGNVIENG